MSLAIAGAAVVFFSVMAFWKHSALMFMITSGASLMLGLEWYDVYVTDTGLTIGLMLIMYSLVAGAFAYSCMFHTEARDGE